MFFLQLVRSLEPRRVHSSDRPRRGVGFTLAAQGAIIGMKSLPVSIRVGGSVAAIGWGAFCSWLNCCRCLRWDDTRELSLLETASGWLAGLPLFVLYGTAAGDVGRASSSALDVPHHSDFSAVGAALAGAYQEMVSAVNLVSDFCHVLECLNMQL